MTWSRTANRQHFFHRAIIIGSGTSDGMEQVGDDAESSAGGPDEAYHVLVGGDGYDSQGPNVESRDLLHTSLTFVGEAYNQLREAGVPRDKIITIVQLNDYLDRLPLAQYPREMVENRCARLIAEGGADYDHEQVNAATVVAVLRGMTRHHTDNPRTRARWPKVIPRSAGTAVFLSVYSHGDSHPTSIAAVARAAAARRQSHSYLPVRVPESMDSREHEWFAHLPYPAQPPAFAEELLAPISTEFAQHHRPRCLLYASQLKMCFSELFATAPKRPIVVLCNFCRSGGMLSFMRNPVARRAFGLDDWPLVLMASSQPEHDALVGGLWTAWFEQLESWFLGHSGKDLELGDLISAARTSYFRKNVYELKDHVGTLAYVSNVEEDDETYPADLFHLCCGGKDGEPDWDGLAHLQASYADGTRYGRKVLIWDPHDWGGRPVDLVKAVREARRRVAIPDHAVGSDGTLRIKLSKLLPRRSQDHE